MITGLRGRFPGDRGGFRANCFCSVGHRRHHARGAQAGGNDFEIKLRVGWVIDTPPFPHSSDMVRAKCMGAQRHFDPPVTAGAARCTRTGGTKDICNRWVDEIRSASAVARSSCTRAYETGEKRPTLRIARRFGPPMTAYSTDGTGRGNLQPLCQRTYGHSSRAVRSTSRS